ncbi:MAG: uridine kinase [Ornithinimicrobium sp.]|uniref:uridine kinase n=1 Tax=Ornithinimicrobium sp. TaxID=1977084 RepID=UPI003D9ACE6D
MAYPGFVPVRQLVLVDLLGLMLAVRPAERAVIAVDGVDGAGKSHLVGELVALAPLVAGRQVLGVSMDGFHHPTAQRYARGRTAQTYYRDAFDYPAFARLVLEPFRAGREIVAAAHDVSTGHPVSPDPVEADDDAVLLVDGVFLHRPELVARWDASLFVHVPFEVSVPRGQARFPGRRHDGDVDPEHPAHARYVGAQRFYLEQAPVQQATWVLDNTELARPQLLHGDHEEPVV